MAISDTIQSMQSNLSKAYDSLVLKGATIPTNKNLENLPAAIDSVSGDVPESFYTEDINGLYDTLGLFLDGVWFGENAKGSYTVDKNTVVLTPSGSSVSQTFVYDSANKTLTLANGVASYAKLESSTSRLLLKQIIGGWSNDEVTIEFKYNGVCKVNNVDGTYFVKDNYVAVEVTALNLYIGFRYFIENEIEYLDTSTVRVEKNKIETLPMGYYRSQGHVMLITEDYLVYNNEKITPYIYENGVLSFTNSNGELVLNYDCVLDGFFNQNISMIREESSLIDIPETTVLGVWDDSNIGMTFTFKENNMVDVFLEGDLISATFERYRNYVIVEAMGSSLVFSYDCVDYKEQLFEDSGQIALFKQNIPSSEDLDAELTAQETAISDLESAINKLPEPKPDMLQARVDATNSCRYLFFWYGGDSVEYISNLDTSKVTDMYYMFYECNNLKTISQLDTSKVTNMAYMFYNCYLLEEVPQLNTSNVTDMEGMFVNCRLLKSVPLSDTSNVTNIRSIFQGCSSLEAIPQLDTSKVTDMYYMFYGCSNLKTIPQLDTSKVTNMAYMFYNCYLLEEIPQLDTSNVTSMGGMFSWCSSLTKVTQLDTSKVSDVSSMFYQCSNIETIDTLDMNKLTWVDSNLFWDCRKLKNLTLKNIRTNLYIGFSTQWGHLLTDESLINAAKELWDMTGSSSKTLTVSTPSNARFDAIYVKLVDVTNEMVAEDEYISNKKPCVVCESTDAGAMTLREYVVSKNWGLA